MHASMHACKLCVQASCAMLNPPPCKQTCYFSVYMACSFSVYIACFFKVNITSCFPCSPSVCTSVCTQQLQGEKPLRRSCMHAEWVTQSVASGLEPEQAS